jgi:hypothetical protein
MNTKRIISAIPQKDFTLILLFDSGELRKLDMNPYIQGGIWGQLKDWEIFCKVNVQAGFGGLIWPNGLDYCPDSAFITSEPLDAKDMSMKFAFTHKKTDKKYKIAI